MFSAVSPRLRVSHLTRAMAVVLFAAFTAVSARVTLPLPFTPVPITLQVLAVVLAGLVLGPKAGAASQVLYLMAIAAGLPLDARGIGTAALMGPTAGYLIGFVLAAFVAGWLSERLPVRRAGRFVAAMAGVLVIYLFGVAWLAPIVGGLRPAWMLGVAPFILVDLGKALAAAAVAESGRWLLSQ